VPTALAVTARPGFTYNEPLDRQDLLGSVAVSVVNVTSPSRTWVGITVALAAAAAFALANTSANVAYHGGSNPLTVAATRFLVPTAALIAWLRVSGVSPVLPKRDAFAATSLGVVTALYTWAFLRSFSAIPFALAVLIFYLFPLMAAVIVAAFGWERFAWKTGAAIVLAFAGLALALDVRGGTLNTEGVALAFLAAIGLAIVIVVSSRVFGKGDARPLTLYMAAVASVLLLMLCAASGDFALPQTASGLIGFVAASALYGFAMIAFFIAISMIGPVRTSLLSYADAVISAGLGVVVLGQALTMVQTAGIALVILALIGATLDGARRSGR
jgi:drug/metabolite transporter (DMT)-like permease